MKICVLTIFPEILSGFVAGSLIGKAIDKQLLECTVENIRDYADPPHFQVDDSPYGGGAGMVLKPEPLARAIEAAKTRLPGATVVLLAANGARFSQPTAHELSRKESLILICGRYEGVDQRVIDTLVDSTISIGDYVLMGGEVAAMAVIEAAVRLIPGVLGNPESLSTESFADNTVPLEGPQYTRPPEFRGRTVPDILLSGDHRKITEWRRSEGLKLARRVRPELIKE